MQYLYFHNIIKTIVPCSLSETKDQSDKEIKLDKVENTMSNMEDGNVNPSTTISLDQFAIDFSDEKICSICLDVFKESDKISWSKHHKCNHVFHYECLTPWLKRHDECPYCRCLMIES